MSIKPNNMPKKQAAKTKNNTGRKTKHPIRLNVTPKTTGVEITGTVNLSLGRAEATRFASYLAHCLGYRLVKRDDLSDTPTALFTIDSSNPLVHESTYQDGSIISFNLSNKDGE